MLLSQHLEPDHKSGASKLNDGQEAGEGWRCPSCRDVIDLAHQVACNCGYRVCQPCWQIAANFGGQCPTCGCPPDMESVRQRSMCGHPSTSSRGDRSTSSSAGSTISRSDTPCPDPSSLHHQHSQPSPRGEQLTPVSDFHQQKRQHQQQHLDQQQLQLQLHQQQQQSVFIRGADRRVLQNLRVIQRTLVYAIGLSPNFAQANTLKQPEYFGQYGDITKLVINHHQGVSPDDPRYGSASAYITFSRQEDAWSAICSVDGFRLMGRTIRASFGTTKYCNSFLRNLPCNNPECLYLHELGDEGDRFTKDEVQLGLARHGSSFAFKEEVLGDRSGGSNSRSSKPRPANPVLPPPCPMTPPAGYEGRLSNNGGSVGGVGRRPAPPHQSAPHASHPGTECTAAPGAGGAVGFGGDVRWAEAPPDSPLPIGADGRPRPRRRRGQRGRRGGGFGGTGGVNMGGRLCDSDEGSMFGSGGMGLTTPAVDVGIGGGGGPSLVRTSSIPVPPVRSLTNDGGAGGYGQGLTSSSLDSAMGRSRAADACAPSALMRPSSASSVSFALSDNGVTMARNSEQRFDAGGSVFGGGGFSNDLHHPAPKLAGQHQSWGGSSDRSTPVGGSYVGRNCWIKGRGSPLDTPETLTNTPPVDLSPSGTYSPTSTSNGLGGTSSQSIWPHRVFGEAGSRDDRDKDGHPASGSIYVHRRHVQLRPPPAFFGIGDGPQASRGQQQNALHEGSRLGDLVSISEFRQTSRQGRSRSLDFVHEQQPQDQSSSRWDGGGGERTSVGVQMQRQKYLAMERAHEHEGEKGVSLFTSLSHGGIGGSVGVTSREPSTIDTSMPAPPGLGLTASGGCNGSGRGRGRVGDRPSSSSYSDDLSSCRGRLAALSWDDSGAEGNLEIAVSSAGLSQNGATSSHGYADGGGSGGGDGGGGDGDERDTWMPPSLASVDSLVASASQAEASQWRRATPKLFA